MKKNLNLKTFLLAFLLISFIMFIVFIIKTGLGPGPLEVSVKNGAINFKENPMNKSTEKVKVQGYWFERLGEEYFEEAWNLCYEQSTARTYPGFSDEAVKICREITDEGIRRWRDRKLQRGPAASKKIEALR